MTPLAHASFKGGALYAKCIWNLNTVDTEWMIHWHRYLNPVSEGNVINSSHIWPCVHLNKFQTARGLLRTLGMMFMTPK